MTNKTTLTVRFGNLENYERAGNHFELDSDFYSEAYDDDLQALDFSCADQDDAAALERALVEELHQIGIFSFWFEID